MEHLRLGILLFLCIFLGGTEVALICCNVIEGLHVHE